MRIGWRRPLRRPPATSSEDVTVNDETTTAPAEAQDQAQGQADAGHEAPAEELELVQLPHPEHAKAATAVWSEERGRGIPAVICAPPCGAVFQLED